jgi:hypothetical protein
MTEADRLQVEWIEAYLAAYVGAGGDPPRPVQGWGIPPELEVRPLVVSAWAQERVMVRQGFLAVALVLALASVGEAQQIPAPSGPVLVCAQQAAPAADSHQLVFDGGAPEAIAMDASVHASCPAGSTHSFRLPPARFSVGQHTLAVVAVNAFGTTTGPVYAVTVGLAPGPATIGAVIVLPQE